MKKQEAATDRAAQTKVYLVGGGIASLAAAAFLIRDANVLGQNITILEEREVFGGSLDGAGAPESALSFSRRKNAREQVCMHL